MKSFFSGSAVIAATILASSFLLSAKPSVAETLLSSFQKPAQELGQGTQPEAKHDPTGLEESPRSISLIEGRTNAPAEAAAEKTAPAGKNAAANPVINPTANAAGVAAAGSDSVATPASAGATYAATAYSLNGRTASGRPVSKGLIAADPRILPLGTRVRLEAGAYSGEYLVADTGGAVHGKKIDIWTPNNREAFRFGRRLVKLTVLSYPVRHAAAVTPRHRRK